jgi:hypothetical protein
MVKLNPIFTTSSIVVKYFFRLHRALGNLVKSFGVKI